MIGAMKRLQAFKFALMPCGHQERQMRRFLARAGSCSTKALALQKERGAGRELGYASLCRLLTEWRNSAKRMAGRCARASLPATDPQGLGAGLCQLRPVDRLPALQEERPVRPLPLPRPETDQARPGQSAAFSARNWLVALPQQPGVMGAVKNITVSQSCGQWFVSIQTEREIEQPIPQGGGRHRHGRGPLCHTLGRHRSTPAEQRQAA